jgi:hypothetical protein
MQKCEEKGCQNKADVEINNKFKCAKCALKIIKKQNLKGIE